MSFDVYQALFTLKTLSLAEQVRLLGTGTERGLLARRLEAVGLEDALEGLGGGAAATGVAAAGGLFSSHGRHRGASGGGGVSRHFVLRMRQTFRMNARSKKWSLSSSELLLEFLPSHPACVVS